MVSFSKSAIAAFLLQVSAVAVNGAVYASESFSLQDDTIDAKIYRALAQQLQSFSAQQEAQEKEFRMLIQSTFDSQQEKIDEFYELAGAKNSIRGASREPIGNLHE
jgi:hypothetical protein